MTLQELLPLLKPFDKIIVVGSQRSGTTLATKVLATELQFQYIFESEFSVENIAQFSKVLQQSRIVVQAPGMSHIAHYLKDDKIAVVFMLRDYADIEASMDRIGWVEHGEKEKAKYFVKSSPLNELSAAQLKREIWFSVQKEKLSGHGFELDYESMSTHPLWVEKGQRGEGIQPPDMGTKTIVEQTTDRLQAKLSLPVVRLSIGAGLHWKIEAGVDYNNPEEEALVRAERRPSAVWINHDGCAHGGIDIVCPWDAIPLPEASVDFLELGDVVEHVPKYDHERIYGHWFRFLKPGGRVHISTPNFHRACVEYALQSMWSAMNSESGSMLAGKVQVAITRHGPNDFISYPIPNIPALPENMTPLQLAMQQIYAWGSTAYEYHYYTYTVELLRAMLEKHGFAEIDFSESPGVDGNPDKSMAWWLCVTAVKQ